MPMSVENARQKRMILAVEPPVGSPVLVIRRLFTLQDQFADLALGSDGKACEPNHLSPAIQGNTVNVVNEAVSERGGG